MAAYAEVESQPSTGDFEASFEAKNRDFRSKAVEDALKPFIEQVSRACVDKKTGYGYICSIHGTN